MNCTTCRFELSQCLDGRLPSGRRAVVLQHADDCAACGAFWRELQAAQELTLRLPRHRVGEDFREQLWARIRAGEGTPAAVFREPVPLAAKLRYALSGAAAAAAVLLAAIWLRGDRAAAPRLTPVAEHSAPPAEAIGGAALAGGRSEALADRAIADRAIADRAIAEMGLPTADGGFGQAPLLSTAQRLTADLVAVEAARQLERRYASTRASLAQFEAGRREPRVVERIVDDAGELRAFGEILLDLRDREWVSFGDTSVDADLRAAVRMLQQERLQERSLDTVRLVVAPALQNARLDAVTRTIRVQAAVDQAEERDVLFRLNLQRPHVFRDMFLPIGSGLPEAMQFLLPGDVFVLEDQCGPIWVAPQSQVEAMDGQLQIRRMMRRAAPQGGSVEIRVERVERSAGAGQRR